MFRQELAQLPLFKEFSVDQLGTIEALVDSCRFKDGENIYPQGAPAQFIYILVKGEVTVRYKPYDGPELTVARITPGGIFGWSAALGREQYTSGAVCEQSASMVRINVGRLRLLCDQYPEIGSMLLDRMANAIAERMSSTHDKVLVILTQGIDPKASM